MKLPIRNILAWIIGLAGPAGLIVLLATDRAWLTTSDMLVGPESMLVGPEFMMFGAFFCEALWAPVGVAIAIARRTDTCYHLVKIVFAGATLAMIGLFTITAITVSEVTAANCVWGIVAILWHMCMGAWLMWMWITQYIDCGWSETPHPGPAPSRRPWTPSRTRDIFATLIAILGPGGSWTLCAAMLWHGLGFWRMDTEVSAPGLLEPLWNILVVAILPWVFLMIAIALARGPKLCRVLPAIGLAAMAAGPFIYSTIHEMPSASSTLEHDGISVILRIFLLTVFIMAIGLFFQLVPLGAVVLWAHQRANRLTALAEEATPADNVAPDTES